MSTQTGLHDLFTFTKKDRIFAIFIVVVIAGSLSLSRLPAPTSQPFALRLDSALVMATDTLPHRQAKKPFYRREESSGSYPHEPTSIKRFTAGEFFESDSNTLSFQDWQRMGLTGKTSKTIVTYGSKGGRFYKPEDLQKIGECPRGFTKE